MRFTTLATVIFFFLLNGCSTQVPDPNKPHHVNGGFRNLYGERNHGFRHFLKWRWQRIWKKIPSADSYNFPLAKNDPDFLQKNRSVTTITWIGHATLLLQHEGKNILTDPHFSERASPVQWAGPKRAVPPGLQLEMLPEIDMVVISHDHYDSLDKQTIKRLRARKDGAKTLFIVPLGLSKWFKKQAITNVVELDWWERLNIDDFEITAVPLQHWGKRAFFSRNDHLWAGWIIKRKDFNFIFVGDTGYASVLFKKIGDTYGPFDLAAVPIGAYEPRWFMKDSHITPEEAIAVHKDIQSQKSIAIHWGTFVLTDEPLDEPPKRLTKAMKEMHVPEEEFLLLRHGETIIFDRN